MKNNSLENKIQEIHQKIQCHKQIKGSILTRDDGLYISSNLPIRTGHIDHRKISAHITTIFRHLSKQNNTDEAKIVLPNGINLYMKHIPSKKILFTSLTDNNAPYPVVKYLMRYYSQKLQKVFS